MSKGKVVVGMSGGVDSTVAAYLLKEQGYEVIGVTMQIWQKEERQALEENGGCCGLSAVSDARRVAFKLDIPYYVMNFRDDFKKYVIDYFAHEYVQGRTPNPCIACNRYVKWESLLQRAKEIGADFIATGHYASIERHPKTGRLAIKASASEHKDQTYVLYNLTQEQLAHTIMPVGVYEKNRIREIASQIDISVSAKKDSQEICFIPNNDYAGFLQKECSVNTEMGNFVDTSGKVLGKHKGIIHYTVGQRKGLGMTFGKPMYVFALRPETNEVILCANDALFQQRLLADDINFMALAQLEGEVQLHAKIRYSHKKAACTVRMCGTDKVECFFDKPQRAITPGQSVVFYDGEYIALGGRIISSQTN